MSNHATNNSRFPWNLVIILAVLFFGYKLTLSSSSSPADEENCGCQTVDQPTNPLPVR